MYTYAYAHGTRATCDEGSEAGRAVMGLLPLALNLALAAPPVALAATPSRSAGGGDLEFEVVHARLLIEASLTEFS